LYECNIYFGGGGESFSSLSGHGSCLPTFSHIHLLGGKQNKHRAKIEAVLFLNNDIYEKKWHILCNNAPANM